MFHQSEAGRQGGTQHGCLAVRLAAAPGPGLGLCRAAPHGAGCGPCASPATRVQVRAARRPGSALSPAALDLSAAAHPTLNPAPHLCGLRQRTSCSWAAPQHQGCLLAKWRAPQAPGRCSRRRRPATARARRWTTAATGRSARRRRRPRGAAPRPAPRPAAPRRARCPPRSPAPPSDPGSGLRGGREGRANQAFEVLPHTAATRLKSACVAVRGSDASGIYASGQRWQRWRRGL